MDHNSKIAKCAFYSVDGNVIFILHPSTNDNTQHFHTLVATAADEKIDSLHDRVLLGVVPNEGEQIEVEYLRGSIARWGESQTYGFSLEGISSIVGTGLLKSRRRPRMSFAICHAKGGCGAMGEGNR